MKINFDYFKSIQSKDINYIKNFIKQNLLNKNNKLKSFYFKLSNIEKYNLKEIYENILYYTSFLDKNSSWVERIFCIMNDIKENKYCEKCKKIKVKFLGCFSKGYYQRFCSKKCSRQFTATWFKLSVESSKSRSEKLSKKLKGRLFTKEWKIKLSISAKKDKVQKEKRKTNLLKNGVENPGVLGAYYSKSGRNYILNFIIENKIDINLCYFNSKELNKKEFFQMIYCKKFNKHIYFSYDLVVFKTKEGFDTKNLNDIYLILEYNGPWHYLLSEIILHENEPSVPYKNCSNNKTKKDVYDLDLIKLNHIKKYCNNIFIFWEKFNFLEIF